MAESGSGYVLREFKESDYEEFASWWDTPPPKTSLPRIGIVCGDMDAVGFLANTDTDFAIITWWHAKPNGKESYKKLKKVVMALMETAVIIGKTKVFCYTNIRGMIRLLESLGFENHDGHLIVEVR